MKNLFAVSKYQFDYNFNNEKIKNDVNTCYISILDCDNNEKKYDNSLDNFLQVKFWDIEEDIYKNDVLIYEKPSDIELKKIVDFVEYHKNKTNFVTHCSAGISRSGAVTRFLFDKFYNEINKESYNYNNRYIQPNLYIYNRLIFLNGK